MSFINYKCSYSFDASCSLDFEEHGGLPNDLDFRAIIGGHDGLVKIKGLDGEAMGVGNVLGDTGSGCSCIWDD